jgi:catechol 2,3-dioxygenase-like lactoylglutathione lyase family enzyme
MTLTGFGNLAVKVQDIDAALTFYEEAGARIGERGPWHGGERADLFLGPVQVTLFTRAIYEDAVEVDLPDECFLHMAVFTDDLDAALSGRHVLWGPAEVEGNFGRRRIAFVEAPGGFRLEFMQQLDGGTGGGENDSGKGGRS